MDSPTVEKLMNACPSCGEVVDVTACAPFSKVICPNCAQAIRVRTDFHHFTIRRQIGEGGMSRVFEAEDQTLGRKVALKILNPQFSQDEKRSRGFEKEARMTAAIQHPNVVSVYSVDRDQGQLFIAMELVPGGNLDERIHSEKKLPEGEVLEIGLRIAEGLKAAHDLGLIHRDIKPGNILFSENGEPKLVDFGLALMFEKDVDEDDEIWATPFYVPPEKLHKKPEDFRSDIYSLGATLFHAVVGHPPFDAKSSSLEELKAIKDREISISDSAPWLSKQTCLLIDRMMARNPAERPESYDDLLSNFRFARREVGSGTIGGGKKNSLLVWGAAAVLALVAGLTALSLGGGGKGGNGNGTSAPVTEEGGIKAGEGRTNAQRFVEARRALVRGRPQIAAKEFKQLAESKDVKQPTLNWSRFNLGLGELLAGRPAAAETWFKMLKDRGSDPGEDVNFLSRLGQRMTDPLPVLNEERSSFESSPFKALAWLAFALKNWEHGEFQEASLFMKAFEEERPPATQRWIAEYKPLIRPYEGDLKVLLQAPSVARDAGLEEAREALEKNTAARKKIRTAGRAREIMDARIERLDRRVAHLDKVAKIAGTERLSAILAEETARLEALKDKLTGMTGGVQFAEAVALIEAENFEHPDVRAEFEREAYVWKTGDLFIRTLIEDLNAHGYEGMLERDTGSSAKVEVTGATLEDGITFRLSGSSSESTMSLSDVAPSSFLAIAEELAMQDPDMEQYVKRQEYMAVFAYKTGQAQKALETAEEVALYNPAFRERWKLVIDAGAGS